MGKITKQNGKKTNPIKLTNSVDVPFVVCFREKLEKGFTFEELEKRNNKEFQSFLDKISNMNVTQVDKLYRRLSDKNDTHNGNQVFHYQITDSFRLHVINYNGNYEVIRLDPNHRVHDK